MKRWISIGNFIINTEYFNLFYIEEVPGNNGYEWHIFGEDKSQVCWRIQEYREKENALAVLMGIRDCLID